MDTRVLVAGAGPTGLTLALDLARRGVRVQVVDKADRFSVGSRGDGISPRTLNTNSVKANSSKETVWTPTC